MPIKRGIGINHPINPLIFIFTICLFGLMSCGGNEGNNMAAPTSTATEISSIAASTTETSSKTSTSVAPASSSLQAVSSSVKAASSSSLPTPINAKVLVNAEAPLGTLLRTERFNNFGGASNYSNNPSADIDFMNTELNINGTPSTPAADLVRVWISEYSFVPPASGDWENGTYTLNASTKVYLDTATRYSKKIFVIIEGISRFVKDKTWRANARVVTKKMMIELKTAYPQIQFVELVNEADNPEWAAYITMSDFYPLWKNMALGVKDANDAIGLSNSSEKMLVGGSAIMSLKVSAAWFSTFLNAYRDDIDSAKVTPDFVSMHTYSYKRDMSSSKDVRLVVDEMLQTAGLPVTTPVYLSETGLYPGSDYDMGTNVFDPVGIDHDRFSQAAGMATQMYWYINSTSKNPIYPFNWVLRHAQYTRKDQLVTPSRGSDGKIITTDPQPQAFTPYGNSLKMFSMLKKERLDVTTTPAVLLSGISPTSSLQAEAQYGKGIFSLASRDSTGISVMVWNYQQKNTLSYTTDIQINNLPSSFTGKKVKVETYLIDTTHSNYWYNNNLKTLEQISTATLPHSGSISATQKLEPNAMVLLVLTPTT